MPEHTIAELGREKARDIVHFTLANVEALIGLNEQLPAAVQKAGEVRRVETMNVFTTQAVFDDFSAAVREFDEAYPELRGRGRLIEREELKSVRLSIICGLKTALAYCCDRSMAYTMRLEAIWHQLALRGLTG